MWIVIFFVPVLYYCIYLIYHTLKFIAYQPKYIENQFFVSVIIPVRNEQKNIKACLESIINQLYPKNLLEIIIVNDHSEDETVKILDFFKGFEFVKILDLPEGKKGKKESIDWGIKHSRGEIIVTSDGDTWRGQNWLQSLVNYFDKEVAMVSGPVKLTGKGIWQEMQALEFSGLILLGGAMIAIQKPSLCNGANLAYRKKVYEEVNGFENIDHIASGDDELLLHKIRRLKKYQIVFAKNSQAIVETPAHHDLKTFVYQRIRWTSKSTVYPDRWITFHLIMAYFANLSIFLSSILMFFSFFSWKIVLGLFLMKVFSEFVILFQATRFFNQLSNLRWLLIEQFFHIIYVLCVGLISQMKLEYEWKGRRVK